MAQVTRTNYCANPNFEVGINFWDSPVNCSLIRSSVKKYSGNYAGQGTVTTSNTGTAIASTGGGSGMVPVTAGQSFSASVLVQGDSAAVTPTRDMFIVFYFRDSGGAVVGGGSNGTTKTVDNANWTQLTNTATVPANAVNVQINVNIFQSTVIAGDIVYVDQCWFGKVSFIDTYFDGNTPATSTRTYSWTGTAGLSTSVETLILDSALDGAWYAYMQQAVGISNLSVNELSKKFYELKTGMTNSSVNDMANAYWKSVSGNNPNMSIPDYQGRAFAPYNGEFLQWLQAQP